MHCDNHSAVSTFGDNVQRIIKNRSSMSNISWQENKTSKEVTRMK